MLDEGAQRRRQVVRLEVVPCETCQQDVHTIGWGQRSIDDDHLLAPHAARPAPNVVAHLAEQRLFPHLYADAGRKLLQLLAQRLVTSSHADES